MSKLQRFEESGDANFTLNDLPKVLNVFADARGTLVLMTRPGLESMALQVLRFVPVSLEPSGLQPLGIEFAWGC